MTQERNPFQLTPNDILKALSANSSQFGPSDFDILSAHQRSTNQHFLLNEGRNFNVIPKAEGLPATSTGHNISSSSALEAYQRYEPAVQTSVSSSHWNDYTNENLSRKELYLDKPDTFSPFSTNIQKSMNQIHDIDSNDASATPYNLNLKTVEEEDEFLYGDSNSLPEAPKSAMEESIKTNLRRLDTGWSDEEDPYSESSNIKSNSKLKNTSSWDAALSKVESARESQNSSLIKGSRQLLSPAMGHEVLPPKKVVGQTAKFLVSDKNPVGSVESRSKYHAAAEILKRQTLENKKVSKNSSYEMAGNFGMSPQRSPDVEHKLVKNEKLDLKTDKTKNVRQVPKKFIDNIRNYLTDPLRKRVHPPEEFGADVKHFKSETPRRLSPPRHSPNDSRHRSPMHYRHPSPSQRPLENDPRKKYSHHIRGSGSRPHSPSPRRRSRERKYESHRYRSPERRSRSPGYYRSRRSRSPGYRPRDKKYDAPKTGSRSRRTPERHFSKKKKKSRSHSRDSFCSLSFDSESSSSSSSSSSDSSADSSDEKKKKAKQLPKKTAIKDKKKNEDKTESSLKGADVPVKALDKLLPDIPKNTPDIFSHQGEANVTDPRNEMLNSLNLDKDKLTDFLELMKNNTLMNKMMEDMRQKSLAMDHPSTFSPVTIASDINTVPNTHIPVPQSYPYPTMSYESNPVYIPPHVENFHPVISTPVFPVQLPPDTYGPHPTNITLVNSRPVKKPVIHRNSALKPITISDTLTTPSIVNTNASGSSSSKPIKSASSESLQSTQESVDKKTKDNSKPVVGSTSEKNKVAIMQKYKRMKAERQLAHCKVNSAVEDMVEMRKQLDEAFGKKVNQSEKFIHSKCKNLLNVANDSVTTFLKDARRIDDELGRFKAKLPTALQTELSNIKVESIDFDDGSNDPDEVYSCFDSGDHMCYQCNAQFKSASDMMIHIQTPAHIEKSASDNSWTSHFKKESKPVDDKKKTVLQSIKGIEFMKPLSGFYCSLCREVVLDIPSAEQHLKGHDHFVKYRTFAKKNPLYERKCLFKRYIQISISAKQKRMKEAEEKKQRLAEHKKNKEAAEKRTKEIIESQRKLERNFDELEEDSNIIPTTSNQKSTDIKLNLSEKDKADAKENDRETEKEKAKQNEREKNRSNEKQKSKDDEKEKVKLSEKSKSSKEAESKNAPKYIYIGKAPNYKKTQVPKSVKEVPWYKRETYLSKKDDLNIGDIPLPNIIESNVTASEKNLTPEIKSSNHDNNASPKSISKYSKSQNENQLPKQVNLSDASLSKAMPSNFSSQKSSNNANNIPMEIDNSQDPKTKPKLATEEEKDFFILGITKEDFKPLVIPVPPPSSVISYPISSSAQNFLPANTACNTVFTANVSQNVATLDFSVPPPSIVPYQNNRSNVPMYGNANCTQSAGQYSYPSNTPSVPLYSNQLPASPFSTPPPMSPFRTPPPAIPYANQHVSQFPNINTLPPNTGFLNTSNICQSTAPFSNINNSSPNAAFSNTRNIINMSTIQNSPPPPISNNKILNSTPIQGNIQSVVYPETVSEYSSSNTITLPTSNSKVTPTTASPLQSKNAVHNFKNKGNLITIVPKTNPAVAQKLAIDVDSKTVKEISNINTKESSIIKSDCNKIGNIENVDKNNETTENKAENVLSGPKRNEKNLKPIVSHIDSQTSAIIPEVIDITEDSESSFNANKSEQEQNTDSIKLPVQESGEVSNKENDGENNKNAENVLSETKGTEIILKPIISEMDSKISAVIPKVLETTEHLESTFNANKYEQEQGTDSMKLPVQESAEVSNKENDSENNKNVENVLSETKDTDIILKPIVSEMDSKISAVIPKVVETTEHTESSFNANKNDQEQNKDSTKLQIQESGEVGNKEDVNESNKNAKNLLCETKVTEIFFKPIVSETDSKTPAVIPKVVEITGHSGSTYNSNENEQEQNITDSTKLPVQESSEVSNKDNVDEYNKNTESVLSETKITEKNLKPILSEIDSRTSAIIPEVIDITEDSESSFNANKNDQEQNKDGTKLQIQESGDVGNKEDVESNKTAENLLHETKVTEDFLKPIVFEMDSKTPAIIPKVVEIAEHFGSTYNSNENEQQNIKDSTKLPVHISGEVSNNEDVDEYNKNAESVLSETKSTEKILKPILSEIDSKLSAITPKVVEAADHSESAFISNKNKQEQNKDSTKLAVQENDEMGNNEDVGVNDKSAETVSSETKGTEEILKPILSEIDSKASAIKYEDVEITKHSESTLNSNENELEQNIKYSTKLAMLESSEASNKENADENNRNVLNATEDAEKDFKAIVPEIDSKAPTIVPKIVEVAEHFESTYSSNDNEQKQIIEDRIKFPTEENSGLEKQEFGDKENTGLCQSVGTPTTSLKVPVSAVDEQIKNDNASFLMTKTSVDSDEIENKKTESNITNAETCGKQVDFTAATNKVNEKLTDHSGEVFKIPQYSDYETIGPTPKRRKIEKDLEISPLDNYQAENQNSSVGMKAMESTISYELSAPQNKDINQIENPSNEQEQNIKDSTELSMQESGVVSNKENVDECNKNAESVLNWTEVPEMDSKAQKIAEVTEHAESDYSSNKNEFEQNIKDSIKLSVEESGKAGNKQNLDKNNENVLNETEGAKNLKADVSTIVSKAPTIVPKIVEVAEHFENTYSSNENEQKQNIEDSMKLPTEENSDFEKQEFGDKENTGLCQSVDTPPSSLKVPVSVVDEQIKNDNVQFLMTKTSVDSGEIENKITESNITNTETCGKQIDFIVATNKVNEKLADNSGEVFKIAQYSDYETIAPTPKRRKIEKDLEISSLDNYQAENQSYVGIEAMKSTSYELSASQNSGINQDENLSNFQMASPCNPDSSKEFSVNAKTLHLDDPSEVNSSKNSKDQINIQNMEIDDSKIIDKTSLENFPDSTNSQENCEVPEDAVCEVSVIASKNQIAVAKNADIPPIKDYDADSSISEAVIAKESTADNQLLVHSNLNLAHNTKPGYFENEKSSTFEKSEICDMEIDNIESVEHSKMGGLSANNDSLSLKMCDNQTENSTNFNETKICVMDVDQDVSKIQNIKESDPRDLSTKCDNLKIGEDQNSSQNIRTENNTCIEKSINNFHSGGNSNESFKTVDGKHSDPSFFSANTGIGNIKSIESSACENKQEGSLQNQSSCNIVGVKESDASNQSSGGSSCDTAFQNVKSGNLENETISFEKAEISSMDIDQVMSESNNVEKSLPVDSSFLVDEQNERNSMNANVCTKESYLSRSSPINNNLDSSLNKTSSIENDHVKFVNTSVLLSKSQSSKCSLDSSLGEIPISSHDISNQTFSEPMDLDAGEGCLKVNLVPEESKDEVTCPRQNQNSVGESPSDVYNSTNDCHEQLANLQHQKEFVNADIQKNSESQSSTSITTNLSSAATETRNTLSEIQLFRNSNVHTYENNQAIPVHVQTSVEPEELQEPEKNAVQQEKSTIKEEKTFDDNLLQSDADVSTSLAVEDDVPVFETQYQGNEAAINENAAKTLNLTVFGDSTVSQNKKTESSSLPIGHEAEELENTNETSKSSNAENEMEELLITSDLPPKDAEAADICKTSDLPQEGAEASDTSKTSDLHPKAGAKNESDTDEYDENDEV